MNYYKQKQFLAEVSEKDEIIGKVEKWEAHKKGILHRGYTALLLHEDHFILQYRKHPVFDGVFDLSFSSHQIYKGDTLQSDEEAIVEGLEREWGIQEKDIESDPKLIKTFYYKAFDDAGGYYEHEMDRFFSVQLRRMPQTHIEFAYGMFLLHKQAVKKLFDVRVRSLLAPWVDTVLHMNLLA